MNLTPNAITVLESRYLLRDADGVLHETPEQLFRRVANAIAMGEKKFGGDPLKYAEAFYELMASLRFLPNSPTLMNAGLEKQQLSACFVLPVEDSLEGIFDTLKEAALIHQSGGGTGFNFSKIRPKNDFIPASGGTASGPVSFMELFDASTERIKQGGKRRGANMGILNCDHPDVEEFISAKTDVNRLRNFNISVGVYDAFLDAVKKKAAWPLIHPNTRKTVREIPAVQLWDSIIDHAWRTGDPGLVFLDALEKANPTPAQGVINCTNPCGEVPLLPFEACNLGSVNLSLFVISREGKPAIDIDALGETVMLAVRFLDNVVEQNQYILPQIEKTVRGNRKIGLGVMGWAEMLILLGIPYASEEAIALGKKLMKFINEVAKEASHALCAERGTFPEWIDSVYAPAVPLRNATRTAIAPTGTIGVIAGTSPSIEPLFALAFRRENVLGHKTLVEENSVVTKLLGEKKLLSEHVLKKMRGEGHVENTDLPAELKLLLKTAQHIGPHWHLAHQAAFQEFTDNAVSKTINLPNSAAREDIAQIYSKARDLGLKGITVFRDGCKPLQVMNAGTSCEVCAT
ncbi:MAG TPA: adenosylcobalamin-dependent ribonucleoside-diphosphate reductase [Bacteroidia bacterium]|nr:adenosylcobalamin-dependent ribonucleoside-diphosphate reductase [Bacteroidia bacterium]